jgi:hypothetical protein
MRQTLQVNGPAVTMASERRRWPGDQRAGFDTAEHDTAGNARSFDPLSQRCR